MNRRHFALVLIFTLLSVAISPSASLRSEETPSGEAAANERKSESADARESEKQKRAMAGLLALCGIVIGGLMFVIFVMVWGARLRRLARRELPAQKTLQNELWFLKPPKPPLE